MYRLLPILAQAANPNTPVTITFIPSQVITWIIIGLIAGFLANLIVRGRRISSLVAIILGILGAIVGGFLFTIFNIQVPPVLQEGITIRWIDIISALIGAIIILIIFLAIFRRRW